MVLFYIFCFKSCFYLIYGNYIDEGLLNIVYINIIGNGCIVFVWMVMDNMFKYDCWEFRLLLNFYYYI